jgi:hypothetical protein
MENTKLTTISTNDTEDESYNLDKKFFREIKKLESWFNPQATRAVEDYNYGRELTLDQLNLALFSAVFIKEPTNYEESLNCEWKEDQIKWKEEIKKDFKEI